MFCSHFSAVIVNVIWHDKFSSFLNPLIVKLHLTSEQEEKVELRSRDVFWIIPSGAFQDYQVCGNGNQFELGYCMGEVRVAAVARSALSDATHQNCIPAPRAFCQSKAGKDMGVEQSGGRMERRMGSKWRTVPVRDQNRQQGWSEEVGGSGNNERNEWREKGRQD